MKNKNYFRVFLFLVQKYGKILSVSSDNFIKPLIFEEW